MKKTLLALSIPYILSAYTMQELFEALKNHSQTKFDTINVKKAEVAASQVTSQLYPTISLFGSYDNYSSPTNMKPISPNTMQSMLASSSTAQPYSYNIYKAGATFSVPIFVKSIYSTAQKARALQRSAKERKKINLLEKEAIIVGSNANLLYLEELELSLQSKEDSLKETQKILDIKVKNARASESALYIIDEAINQVNITKNNIEIQKQKLISTIQSITNIRLQKSVTMQKVSTLNNTELGSLKPLQEKLRASRLEIKAQKDKLYPSVSAFGSYYFATATSYNNSQSVDEEYGDIGVLVTIPLLAMNQYQSIEKAKLELQSDNMALEKLRDELNSKADMLKSSLSLLDDSLILSNKSIENKQKLLDIAKVSYKSGRLIVEEYLRYEDDMVDAKAKLYQVKAQKWQTLMELAVVYANNIEEIVQ
ncbi:MAG: outer membrane protein TolC [Sulfurimonas sp.]|jgi:outer membrane protein TolC